MPQTLNLSVGTRSRHRQALGQRGLLHHQRVVARNGKPFGQSDKKSLAVIGDDVRFAVHDGLGSHHVTAEHLPYRLMSQTELRSSLRNFESQNEYGYKPCIKRRFQNAETLQSRNQKNSS